MMSNLNDDNIAAYIACLPRSEAAYAARYAHWLDAIHSAQLAREHAESNTNGLPLRRRMQLRTAIYKIVHGLDETIRVKMLAGI